MHAHQRTGTRPSDIPVLAQSIGICSPISVSSESSPAQDVCYSSTCCERSSVRRNHRLLAICLSFMSTSLETFRMGCRFVQTSRASADCELI